MNLLAIDTSTEACSLALSVDGALHVRHAIAPRRHAELALPWADALLAEAGLARTQLDAIAVSRGPGAFTGVRLGLSIAQGIALALDLPLVAVSSLRVLAAGSDAARVVAAIDARMGEVYLGAYTRADGVWQLLGEEAVASPQTATLPAGDGWAARGTGFAAVEAALAQRAACRWSSVAADALPHAADLARLALHDLAAGLAVAPERVEPAYLRDRVALTIAQRAAGETL